MAIVAVSISPIGVGTSVSDYVAEAVRVAMNREDLQCELGAMFTTLEGSLPAIFDTIHAMQEAVFAKGASRVSIVVKVDERRDRDVQMEEKIASVQKLLE